MLNRSNILTRRKSTFNTQYLEFYFILNSDIAGSFPKQPKTYLLLQSYVNYRIFCVEGETVNCYLGNSKLIMAFTKK